MPRSTTTTISDDVLAMPLADVLKTALKYCKRHRLLVGLHDSERLKRQVNKVAKTCRDLGIRDMDDLIVRSRDVITGMTGAKSLTQAAGKPARIHRTRNLVAAIIVAALNAAGHDADSTLARLPKVFASQAPDPRPLRDDEVLLLRLRSVFASLHWPRQPLFAIQYALTEAGARPSEATAIIPKDFDDPRHPAMVRLPGVPNGVAQARTIALPEWSQMLLTRCLDRHLAISPHASTMPIAYFGRRPCRGHEASAAASTNLKRAMKESGIAGGLPVPTSIVRWRVAQELRTGDVHDAKAVMGCGSLDKVYSFTGTRPKPSKKVRPETFVGR